MTEADIACIESGIGIVVPIHYRVYMLAYPQALYDAKYNYNDEPASATFLFDDPEQVIDSNKEVRDPRLLVPDGEPQGYRTTNP